MIAVRPIRLAAFVLCGLIVWPGPWPALAQGRDASLWRSIAEGLRQGVVLKRRELGYIQDHLPLEKATLAGTLARCSSRLDQVLLLRGVAGETPWASRTLLMELGALSDAVTRARGPLEDIRDRLSRAKKEYATLRQIRAQNASREYTDLLDEALAGPGRDFKVLKGDVDAVKQEVDGALAQATALSGDIDQAREEEIQRFIGILGATYFASSGSLLHIGNLTGAWDDLQQWRDAAPRFWLPVISWTNWEGFGLVAGLDFALLLGALAVCMRRWPVFLGPARPGLVWLAAGLALLASRHTVLFAANQFTSLLWVLLASRGVVLLIRSGPTLSVLFGCFTAAMFMDALNLPASLIGAAWPVVAGVALWRLRAAGAVRSPAVWIVALSGVAAILGYGPQGTAAVQATFMLQLTVSLAGAIERGLSGLAADKKRSLAALAAPLAVTLVITLYVAWMLVFLGGPGLMDHVFAVSFQLGRATVSLEAIAGLCIAFFLLRLVQAWFVQLLGLLRLRGKAMEPALVHTMGAAFAYLTWMLFLVFGLHLFAVPLGALTWIVSGLSVGIGFGLKDIVNNFVSGLIIMFGGAVKKGDIIQQGKNLGEVVDLSVRNTIIRTLDNTTVIIPNSSFLRGEIVNLTFQDATMRLTIPVTVAPGTKIKKVRKILTAIAKEHPDVLKKPPPEVFMNSLGRYGLQFELYVWIDNFMKKFQVQSELATAIDQQFQDNKILVAFQGVKMKYKPKGTEAMQLEATREELRRKRSEMINKVRVLRRVHARRRWPSPTVAPTGEQ